MKASEILTDEKNGRLIVDLTSFLFLNSGFIPYTYSFASVLKNIAISKSEEQNKKDTENHCIEILNSKVHDRTNIINYFSNEIQKLEDDLIESSSRFRTTLLEGRSADRRYRRVKKSDLLSELLLSIFDLCTDHTISSPTATRAKSYVDKSEYVSYSASEYEPVSYDFIDIEEIGSYEKLISILEEALTQFHKLLWYQEQVLLLNTGQFTDYRMYRDKVADAIQDYMSKAKSNVQSDFLRNEVKSNYRFPEHIEARFQIDFDSYVATYNSKVDTTKRRPKILTRNYRKTTSKKGPNKSDS
jgi:hypothetical protein